jgi:hypothetical protein
MLIRARHDGRVRDSEHRQAAFVQRDHRVDAIGTLCQTDRRERDARENEKRD